MNKEYRFPAICLIVSIVVLVFCLTFIGFNQDQMQKDLREQNNRISNLEHFVDMGDLDLPPKPAKDLPGR